MTPSHDGALVDGETAESIGWLPASVLPQEKAEELYAWSDFFRQLADPHDPSRSSLKDPSRQAEIEEAGRPVYEWLVKQLGPDRVAFEPAARPKPPVVHPNAVKVMADYQSDPLWFVDSEDVGCIFPHALGISWSLAEDLVAWGGDFDGVIDWDNPGGEPKWSEAQFAAHEARGRALAERLSSEFARTGRANVPVWFHGHMREPERIS